MNIVFNDDNINVNGVLYSPKDFINKASNDTNFIKSIINEDALKRGKMSLKLNITICLLITLFGAIPLNNFASILNLSMSQIIPLIIAHFTIWIGISKYNYKLWFNNTIKADTCIIMLKARKILNNNKKINDFDDTLKIVNTKEKEKNIYEDSIEKKVHNIIFDIPEQYKNIPEIKKYINELLDCLKIYYSYKNNIENNKCSINLDKLNIIINNKLEEIEFKIFLIISVKEQKIKEKQLKKE